MVDEQLLLSIVGCLALLALFAGFWQGLMIRKLRREVRELRMQVVEATEAETAGAANFSTSLDEIERQQLQTVASSVPRNSAEKYRYVGSLADQGVDADGIAKALQMPIAEVQQLMQLAKIKQAAPAK
jgi:hypothetical protein